jgi:hypothetical protein
MHNDGLSGQYSPRPSGLRMQVQFFGIAAGKAEFSRLKPLPRSRSHKAAATMLFDWLAAIRG